MFDFDLSDELKLIFRKLSKKDRKKAEIIAKKIKENPEKWLSPTMNGGDLRHFS